jgi:sugar lactone lactonase YvrE
MSNKTVFSRFGDEDSKTLGVPDGLCQDENYGCWSARWGAGKVIRLDARGNPDLIVEFPTAVNMTSCIFGGKSSIEVVWQRSSC